ncbi:RHS repeat domain-containing protein [Niveispirillum sp. KHB5.9]|uniref:RHS repeat domain-containing protein n=1 Tax=Niveispirillum sp. KHB5.9 TaxID=3400269 RepID=UPI003A866F9C
MLRLFLVALSAALLCLPTGIASAQSSPPQVTYKYDALGRLIEVRYPNGRVVTYSYDPAGNRRQVVTGG